MATALTLATQARRVKTQDPSNIYASAFRRRRHYVFGLSVRPKPEIPSFDLYMGPLVHPTNRNRFTACPSVRPSISMGLWYWELMSRPDPAVLPVGTLHSLEWFWVSRRIFIYSHHNTYVFSLRWPSVRPSVRLERFPGICRGMHGGIGLKFYMLVYLHHLQNWLVYGRGLVIFQILALFWLSETGQIWGFRAFPGERMEGMTWNFARWCILSTFRTD